MVSLKATHAAALKSALKHLEYSFQKVGRLGLLSKPDWTEEELEVLESFSSRFARASDLFLSRYLRSLVLESDPAFRGSFIDLLNLSEKLGYISSAQTWYRIRELRNVAAHDYATDQLKPLFEELLNLAPVVLGTGHGL